MIRMDRSELIILGALHRYTLRSAAQLASLTGLSSGSLYPALMRLERNREIVSRADDMPYPRRWRYRLAERDW